MKNGEVKFKKDTQEICLKIINSEVYLSADEATEIYFNLESALSSHNFHIKQIEQKSIEEELVEAKRLIEMFDYVPDEETRRKAREWLKRNPNN